MILSCIWERYFLKEILKIFFFFLFCFFFLYSVMDYSLHMNDFISDKGIKFFDVLCYYTFQFIKRATLLIPLALLVSTIKVLYQLNSSRELVALQASGLKLKTILRPFFLIAILCSLFNYINLELLFPKAANYLDQFRYNHFKHIEKEAKKQPVHLLFLKDNSRLFYQSYDASKDSFFDVIWLASSNDIWRIKYLKANPNQPFGQYVDHLQRNQEDFFEKKESFDTYLFKGIKWDPNMPSKGFIPRENHKISELYHFLAQKKVTSSYETQEIITQLYFKLAIPLLPFLVIIAIAPFCVQYSRKIPIFFIYAFSIFGYIAFFALMDASVIIGENNVVSPFLAIFAPLGIGFGAFFWKFSKI